jgi:hypothetical protein
MVTMALAAAVAGVIASVVPKRAEPLVVRVATGLWWAMRNCGVVPAHEAEGHVTVARLRSTTLSARHQVVNRWDIALTGYLRAGATLGAATLHSQ